MYPGIDFISFDLYRVCQVLFYIRPKYIMTCLICGFFFWFCYWRDNLAVYPCSVIQFVVQLTFVFDQCYCCIDWLLLRPARRVYYLFILSQTIFFININVFIDYHHCITPKGANASTGLCVYVSSGVII